MNKMMETVMCLVMGEHFLERFVKEASEIEAPLCEICMKKGFEYIIRGKAPGSLGALKLYLGDAAGNEIPTSSCRNGFTFVAHEDDVNHVWGSIHANGKKASAGKVAITISCIYPDVNKIHDGTHEGSVGENIPGSVPPGTEEHAHRNEILQKISSGEFIYW